MYTPANGISRTLKYLFPFQSWLSAGENIADSKQSSHTRGHSYQRYVELICIYKFPLLLHEMDGRKIFTASWFSLTQRISSMSGFTQNLKTLALIAGEKSVIDFY